ncbi:DUF1800 domain-containing protein [Sphingomonas ginkgonis]|uniref:DUF1800 domain-containing protein n=2 Tax=Sphingomonas ginkgonis TaxID=2315330 RepID=A0A3R9WUT5_9SPHN|nr:DUF1800 domain-containing protein [Sphingomonas ginkgonis]
MGARGDGRGGGNDPRGWVEAQIGAVPQPAADLPSRAGVVQAILDYRQERRELKSEGLLGPAKVMPASMATGADIMSSLPAGSQPAAPGPAQMDAARPKQPEALKAARSEEREIYLRLVGARTDAALNSNSPFMERMAHFWANHFAVSAQGEKNLGFAGLLEFEAIRPNLDKRFADMVLAVEQHPAMLFYLDQAGSIGPNSQVGGRVGRNGKTRGLNENLAREILELHTLGVRSGYTQADVTEFARALTGWSVAGLNPNQRFLQGPPGSFVFAEAFHEPGARTIMGKTYPEDGEAQTLAVLEDVSVHPATAHHIATKLARHFAADNPPPAMVARIEKAFLKSRGDLPTVYRALIASPEAWSPENRKFRTPWDWTVASLRAVSTDQVKPEMVVSLLQQLGQPVWRPGSPAGYDDIAASWAAPDALVRRVEAAQRIAQANTGIDARALAPHILGASLTPATATAISRAESPQTGLALMLVSPEFLRR